MTLETFRMGNSKHVRLVECPFCEVDLRDAEPAEHLRRCGAARDAIGGIEA